MSNIKVAVRVRPPIESELRSGDQPSWITRGNSIYVESGKINAFYTFDHIFDCASTNRDVYDKYCHPIVESVMQGFNGTIFAFGQTSSGKTHTMMGTASQPGLIPLAINAIFNIIENDHRSRPNSVPEREYLIRVSYIEIYNENIMDLLDPTYGKNLQLRDNADGQPIIVELTELMVGSKEEIQTAMSAGERRRHVASTEANQRSSRSHTIFRMVIESSLRDEGADKAVTVGQLNLVDLAGSERSEQCGEAGERFRESTRINLSLTFLTQVISKLSRGERGHINFRDSKLTRILRNSLGGNAHTAIVCTVNPYCADQTLRTLQFASSAKKIQNTPVVNESVSSDTLIRRYHLKIEELKCKIKAMEDKHLCKTLQEKNSQIEELHSKVRLLQEKLVVSTLPAPSTAEWRKQRRETWAAPSSLVRGLTKERTASESMVPHEPLDIFQEWGRLSTVIEESETFHAISTEDFEKHLQREERNRTSAALHLGDSEPTALPMSDISCAERIKFLESENMLLRKEYAELKELTTLERLMCNTSRRPVPCGKLDEADTTPPLSGQLKECCVKAVLKSKQRQERASCKSGGFKFFSPPYTSPMLTLADRNSSTLSSSHDNQEGECLQASKPYARLTPRTTLWTPSNSPIVGNPGHPGLTPLGTPHSCDQPVSKPLCAHGAMRTDDVESMQVLQPPVTLCAQMHEDSMLHNILTMVEACCQTDSEDGREKRSSTGGQPRATAAELVEHSSSCTCKKTRTQTVEVQTVDAQFTALEELSEKPRLVETSILRCLGIGQHVDCGIQTEIPARCLGLHLEEGETECMPLGFDSQLSSRRHSTQHEKEMREIKSRICCGSQTSADTEDSASQVNKSLADGSAQDFAAQVMVQMQSCASQMDVQFSRIEAVDCAVQCDLLLQNYNARERAIDAVDCEAQTSLSVQECTVQTELSLLHRNVADYAVQAMPSMLDAATEVEQVSRIAMLDAGVQTASPCSHDRSMQSECRVLSEAVADFEVQAVPFTKDSASQVNASLDMQEISILESTRLSFAAINSSHLDKSLMSQVRTPSSGNGSTNHWQRSRHGGTVWAAVRASLLKSSEESADSKTMTSDCQSTPFRPYRNDVGNSRIKPFAFGTRGTMVETQEQVPRIGLVDTSMQTKFSSCDRSTQSVHCIPQSAVADCDVQAVPSTRDTASQVNASLASQEVCTSEPAQCSVGYNRSQLQKSFRSESPDAAPNPPTYSARMSASGSGTAPQQNHCSRGTILDAIRSNLLKPAEDSAANGGNQKVPSSYYKGATSSLQSGTSAAEIHTWLYHNQKPKESVAVQADTCMQELEELQQQVSSMKLSLDAHEKALRAKDSQLMLQEKASKKRELQLKAVIRQLQNKEMDNTARAALASPTVTVSGKDEAQPPLPARALVHETPTSLARRLKDMTPRAREGARLIYFGQSLEEQAVAEQVQMGQLRASLSSHARKLESARKRHQAWADLRSGSKQALIRTPLKELDKDPCPEVKGLAEDVKDDLVDDMALWPPMKYFMDADKENMDSP